VDDVLHKLNTIRPIFSSYTSYSRKLHTSQWLGLKLKAMGLKRRYVHGCSEIILKSDEFQTLCKQYGFLEDITIEIDEEAKIVTQSKT
jgi:hypothetical protein